MTSIHQIASHCINPMEYKLSRQEDLIIVTVKGLMNLHDTIQMINHVIDTIKDKPCKGILADHLQSPMAQMPVEEIRQIAEHFAANGAHFGQARLAVIFKEKADFGLARMWQMMTGDKSGVPIHIFDCVEEALPWLNENMQ